MESKQKHLAIRTCIATGKKFPKKDLVRFVKLNNQEQIVVDLTGKKSGRGANMSLEPENIDLAFKKKAFERAFKLSKPLLEEDKQRIKSEFLQAIQSREFRKGREKVIVRVSKESYERVKTDN